METTVGYQRLTTVGNVVPTGCGLRLYSVDLASGLSASSLTFYNGLSSLTGVGTIYVRISSGSQGEAHEEWTNGIYFPNGIWLNTGTAGTNIILVGYSRVTA